METYYVQKLKERLEEKQKLNPKYSLRAYSRDLGVHFASLGQVIKGTRPLPKKNAKDVCERLGLTPKEKTLFMESFYRSKTNIDDIEIDPLDQRFRLDESYHNILAKWEYFAVIEMFYLKDAVINEKTVAKKLGLTQVRAKEVIKELLFAKLIKYDENEILVLTHEDITTTEDISSLALKLSHQETLDIAKQKLEEIEVELRDFSSTTVALNLKKLPEAKTIIREFRQKLTKLLRDGEEEEIYQLAIQFFPLSQINKKGELQ